MDIVELAATSGTLKVRVIDESWVHLVFVQDGIERELGAETLKYIVEHLRAFLQRPAQQPKWVLSLAETHVSFYGSASAGGTLLRLQDKNAAFFADLELSEGEKEEWLASLNSTHFKISGRAND